MKTTTKKQIYYDCNKILDFPKKSDCSGGSALIPALASFGVTILFLLALVLVLVLRRRKRQIVAKENNAEDRNPIYGMYYFADGEHIDESRSEFLDDNENYGD